MIPRTLTVLFVGALVVGPLRASQERLLPAQMNTFTLAGLKTMALTTEEFGKIKATFSFRPSRDREKLQDVSLEHQDKKMDVPQQMLAEHPDVVMDSARVTSEGGHGPRPLLYLSFQLRGDKKKRYYIAFNDGRFVKTFIHRSAP